MDHDSVVETLELAAAEPDGLDRLMAGDTTTAAAVTAHLVGCDDCMLELERLRRVSGLVRDVVTTTLPADLRERTLAHVRSHGVPRGDPERSSRPPSDLADRRSGGARRSALGWVAAVAAVVAISVAATTVFVGGRLEERLAAQDDAVRDLAVVTNATLHVTAESDVARVALGSPTEAGVTGTLLFSPSTTELVVVATGLTEPPAGMEYGCWVDKGSGRERVGKMFFGGGLAYWVGPSSAVAGTTGPVTFGISLVDADGGITGPDPVLIGGT